ncbi:M16 family metallopeptidase [Desulfohalovibrio reitneri]|uniref:M16 family metallopeptidase n=1 Tax=Desulfohalovibrio reitneri TaxID=1307759 RepID=UPI00068B2D31|nr:pitrilysin family protein [Desulfohalovibrio reitneri]
MAEPILHRLDNGLRIVAEPMNHVRSLSLGVWVMAGSRHEPRGLEGAAHLWEHMAFKGTSTRSALDIAMSLDRLGGLSNAFTGREETCFHARVVDHGQTEAFDVLADLVRNPRLDPAELDLEKGVVLQELAMVEESPEEAAFEAFWADMWSGSPLSHSILGTEESVSGISREDLLRWGKRKYAPDRIIVSAAGSVDTEGLVRAAEHFFGDLPRGEEPPTPQVPEYTPTFSSRERDTEQSHVLIATPGVSMRDDRRYAFACLSALLGGQMSSRLFQEIRERRGLAYSVYSSSSTLSDCGALQIYAAGKPKRTGELIEVLRDELAAVANGAVTREELARAREHLQGLLLLGAESTEERMLRLAKNVFFHGRHVDFEESARRIGEVSLNEVRQAAAESLRQGRMSLSLTAPRIDPDWLEPFRPSEAAKEASHA